MLIADGQPVVRLGLRAMLSSEPDLEIVGEAADGISAVISAQALQPDVLVMGLRMPDMPGVQVIEQLAAMAPDVRVLILTIYPDDEHIFGALQAGAHGYLLKESAPDALIRAIRDVAAGTSPLAPAVARRVLQAATQTPSTPPSVLLTRREKQVLALVAEGLSNKTIASRLNLRGPTVRTHVSGILAKLNLRSRTEATLWVLRTGFVYLDD